MAYTVHAAFEEFRQNIVDLRATDCEKARTSRDYLIDQMKVLNRDLQRFHR